MTTRFRSMPHAGVRRRCIPSTGRSWRRPLMGDREEGCQRVMDDRPRQVYRWCAAALITGLIATPASAQVVSGALAGAGSIPGLDPSGPVKVLPVRGNIYVAMGAGANVTLSVGLGGVLAVDSGSAEMSAPLLAAIRTVQRWVEARTAATVPPL